MTREVRGLECRRDQGGQRSREMGVQGDRGARGTVDQGSKDIREAKETEI